MENRNNEDASGGVLLAFPNNEDGPEGEGSGDFETLIDAVQDKLLRMDIDLLEEFEGTRLTIEIGDGQFCIEAEDF